MDLLPTIDVTVEIKTKAVEAVCGTGEFDGDWESNPEMLAFYRKEIIKWLRRKYQIWESRKAVQELPAESSYDLGVPEE